MRPTNPRSVISDPEATSGFFAQLVKFLVLDVIVDPTNLTRKSSEVPKGLDKEGKEIDAIAARISFWEREYNLKIPENFFETIDPEKEKLIELPRNTIIGRPYNSVNRDAVSSNESQFLLPFFPSHLSLPCKPGEVVWAFKESSRAESQKKAWWVSKVVEFGTSDDVNFSPFSRVLGEELDRSNEDSPTQFSLEGPEYTLNAGKKTKDGTDLNLTSFKIPSEEFYEKVVTKNIGSKLTIKEPIPRFKGRPSDLILEGSNNTLIVLGTDRFSSAFDPKALDNLSLNLNKDDKSVPFDEKIIPDQDIKEGAGSIDLVVGRGQTPETLGNFVGTKSSVHKEELYKEIKKDRGSVKITEGDPDWINDKSRILISQKTKIDTKLKIKKNKELFQISDDEKGDASILAKSDKVRVVARKDSQIIVGNESGDEIVTICGKDDGNLFLHSKNTSIKIDPDGNITLEAKKDIILKPAAGGLIKLGENANKAILCQNVGVTPANGTIVAGPIIGSMGTAFGAGAFGAFSSKVLVE
jgi:hypothetical protein